MSPEERKRAERKDLLLASLLVTAGLVMAGLSLIELAAGSPERLAQATQPLQSSPPEDQNKPAESKPGGEDILLRMTGDRRNARLQGREHRGLLAHRTVLARERPQDHGVGARGCQESSA